MATGGLIAEDGLKEIVLFFFFASEELADSLLAITKETFETTKYSMHSPEPYYP